MGFNGNVSAGKRLHNCGKIHHFLAGKIHYFDWAIFNSELLQLLPGWVVEMGHLTSRTDVSPCSKGCHLFFFDLNPFFWGGSDHFDLDILWKLLGEPPIFASDLHHFDLQTWVTFENVAEKNTIFKGFEKGELKTNGSFAKKYDIWLVVWNIFFCFSIYWEQ